MIEIKRQICTRCHKRKPVEYFDGGYKSCIRCREHQARRRRKNAAAITERRREYMREYHRAHSRERAPEKLRARRVLDNAVRRGRLTALPCEVCGNPKSEAHHDDYSKPLEVRWLCRKHHAEIHRRIAV